jgi:uncharacterized protein YkvS
VARKLIKDTCPLAAEILDGKHDEILDYIVQAAAARRKMMFRKGMRIRLVGTRNVELEGKEGVVIKVNQKSVTVGLGTADRTPYGTVYADGEYNVGPALLEAI